MKCPNCGNEIEAGQAFCGFCGTRVAAATPQPGGIIETPGPPPPDSYSAPRPEPAAYQARPQQMVYTGGATSGGGLMAGLRERPLVGALIIAGIAVLLVGAVVVLGSGGGSDGTTPAKQAQGPDLPPANGNVLLTPQGTSTPAPTQPPPPTATPPPP